MDKVERIIELAKKDYRDNIKETAYQADMDYADLKADHTTRVQMVQDLLKENGELIFEIGDLKRKNDKLLQENMRMKYQLDPSCQRSSK